VLRETALLQRLEHVTIGTRVRTPIVRHVGVPHEAFAHHWSVLEWLDGDDAWSRRHELDGARLGPLADDLAMAITAVGRIDTTDVPRRQDGSRGGPLLPLLDRLDAWLDSPEWNASAFMDVTAVRRLADEAREVVDEPVVTGFVHGDLIPGNLLVRDGRLAAIIDWGGAGCGDVAQDLAPAWAVLDPAGRASFKAAVGADDAAWIRGRTFELEHAVGGVVYYRPRRHPLGDVMTRTLERILDS
jgi:aminoglycoside phosphotransferase (APT) family kinase protein